MKHDKKCIMRSQEQIEKHRRNADSAKKSRYLKKAKAMEKDRKIETMESIIKNLKLEKEELKSKFENVEEDEKRIDTRDCIIHKLRLEIEDSKCRFDALIKTLGDCEEKLFNAQINVTVQNDESALCEMFLIE